MEVDLGTFYKDAPVCLLRVSHHLCFDEVTQCNLR